MKKWTDDDKKAAAAAMKAAVASGRMKRADHCEVADDTCRGPFHWHHPSYAPSRRLDVVSVCASHHRRIHNGGDAGRLSLPASKWPTKVRRRFIKELDAQRSRHRFLESGRRMLGSDFMRTEEYVAWAGGGLSYFNEVSLPKYGIATRIDTVFGVTVLIGMPGVSP